MKKSETFPPKKGTQTNTGKTHFKKGRIPWNKGKKVKYTENRKIYDENQRAKTKKKPKNFSEIMKKANSPIGRKKHSSGYIYLYKPDHKNSCKKTGYILEHRYVLSNNLGRELKKEERIHHLNGDKEDNRLENLVLCKTNKEHTEIHHKMNKLVFKLIKEGLAYYDGKEFKIR